MSLRVVIYDETGVIRRVVRCADLETASVQAQGGEMAAIISADDGSIVSDGAHHVDLAPPVPTLRRGPDYPDMLLAIIAPEGDTP